MAMVVFTGPIPLWGRVRERGHMSRDFAREELESLNLRLSLRIIRRRGRATGTTGTRTRPTTAWRSKATGDVPAHLVEFSLSYVWGGQTARAT